MQADKTSQTISEAEQGKTRRNQADAEPDVTNITNITRKTKPFNTDTNTNPIQIPNTDTGPDNNTNTKPLIPLDTDIQEKDEKQSHNQQNRARNGKDKEKDKVLSHPISSMAEIDSKEAQMKLKAGICFRIYLTKEAQAASPREEDFGYK
ncbi:hypothetical protein Tco_0928253 [Tanacetum coccineum]